MDAFSSTDQASGDIFYLLISPNYICGYIFNFCGDLSGSTYFTQLKVDDYASLKLANKPSNIINN